MENKKKIKHENIISIAEIERRIREHDSLNYTGFYSTNNPGFSESVAEVKAYDSHTPLTWAIALEQKDLFDRLLKNGADVNCAIDRWEWTPLYYALECRDNYYLKRLMEEESLDISQKIGDYDIFTKLLKSSSLATHYIDNAALLLKERKAQALPILLEQCSKPMLAFMGQENAMHAVKKLPSAWLAQQLNIDLDDTAWFLHVNKSKPALMKKIVKLLPANALLESSTERGPATVLNEYICYHMSGIVSEAEMRLSTRLVRTMLDAGHDIKHKNNKKAFNIIKDMDFYRRYEAEKTYHRLSKELSASEQPISTNSFTRKIKI